MRTGRKRDYVKWPLPPPQNGRVDEGNKRKQITLSHTHTHIRTQSHIQKFFIVFIFWGMQLATRSSRDGKRDILMGVRRRLSFSLSRDGDCIPFFSVSWRSPIAIGSQKNIYTPVVFLLLLFSFFVFFSLFSQTCFDALFHSMLSVEYCHFVFAGRKTSRWRYKTDPHFYFPAQCIHKRWHRHRIAMRNAIRTTF